MVRQQKLAELVITTKLHDDSDARQVTLTPPGGSTWNVEYQHLVRV